MPAVRLPNDRPNQTFLGRARKSAKARGISFNLALSDLELVWSDQLGLCRYSGVVLSFDPKGGESQTASLDRIDSSLSYRPDNIRFTHKTINVMKHTMHSDRFIFLSSQVSFPGLRFKTDLAERKSAGQFRGSGVVSAEFLGHTRQRAAKKSMEYDLDPEYVQDLYVAQRGLCAGTGLVLRPKEYKSGATGNLSIDRLDCGLGYVRGNIRLVLSEVNFMRGNLSLANFHDWCGRITAWNEFIHSDDFDNFYDRRNACLASS